MNETTLIPESSNDEPQNVMQNQPEEKSEIEKELQEKSKKVERVKKVSKMDFIVNLYQGKPGREGDEQPNLPVTEIPDLAVRVRKAEETGYFRVRTGTKTERNDSKYLSEVKWYLTQAAKKKLIDREYNPRKKKVETTEQA